MESKENQTGAGNDKLLKLPHNAGRAIVETSSVNACPVLRTKQFSDFCRERGLSINCERLLRLEHLGLFAPIFRVRTPEKGTPPFYIPVHEGNNWFEKGWAWDTTGIPLAHKVPDHKDPLQEGYYSIFQIGHLHKVLQGLDFQISMDNYLNIDKQELVEKSKISKTLNRLTKWFADPLSMDEHAFSVALLCQFVSNRYFPMSQTDQRTMCIRGGRYSDCWIEVGDSNFKQDWHAVTPHWYDKAKQWQPRDAERLFRLTSEKLFNAYEYLALEQASYDPLAKWYQLIQFVSVSERSELKGYPLWAETLRVGAQMLRFLYQDLYNDNLPHPNEIGNGTNGVIPELCVRQDTRRYLELVTNRYNLNPQPKLSLFVEGKSEVEALLKIFESYYEVHPGGYGIEIIDLHGVDTAVGNKKEDRYSAILRLIDYLHDHQTLTYIILDNENNAKELKKAAENRKSIHGVQRYVAHPDHIRLWKKAFEFDNFSCSEIAAALNELVVNYAERAKNRAKQAKDDAERVKDNAKLAVDHARLAEKHAKLMDIPASLEKGHAMWAEHHAKQVKVHARLAEEHTKLVEDHTKLVEDHVKRAKDDADWAKDAAGWAKNDAKLAEEHAKLAEEHANQVKNLESREKGHAKLANDHAKAVERHVELANDHAKLAEDHAKCVKGHAKFTAEEVKKCREGDNPGSRLQKLYVGKAICDLGKVELCKILVENMMLPNSACKIEDRPIIKILEYVRQLAVRNPFSISEEHAKVNLESEFLGKKYK